MLASERETHMKARILIAVLALCATAAAQTVTGTVTNGTTGRPAAGDEVVLLSLSQGMNESAHGRTDAQGKFSLPLDSAPGPHLVRVTHQGVNYFPAGGPILPGAAAGELAIQVYDAAKKLDGITATVDVMRMQAPDASTLQVIELIAVSNTSSPARTLGGERTWEINLPEGAQIDQADAAGPGGMPVNAMPVPDDAHKGRYYFDFPIRPGETRFQVAYHLLYSGEATLAPHVSGNVQHFAVMLPKSMQFAARSAGVFTPMADETGQSNLQVATNVAPGKDLGFRVSGTGELPNEQAGQGNQAPSAEAGSPMPANRPGGGLGTPEGTPDPLHETRWAILVGLMAILAIGGVWVMSRRQGAQPAGTAPEVPAVPVQTLPAPPDGSVLLQALKEEIFQLEVERQQGKLSDEEYAKAKAALDQTLRRAIARTRATKA
jgi:hypothetical protein